MSIRITACIVPKVLSDVHTPYFPETANDLSQFPVLYIIPPNDLVFPRQPRGVYVR